MGLPALDATPPVHADAPDVVLWKSLAESGSIQESAALRRASGRPGPFLDESLIAPMGGVEVWTETELASIHALMWDGALRGDRCACMDVLEIARWHIEHTQPDNATNRPWAVHVFLMLGELDPTTAHEARLYAQTLAHNCRVTLGVPDAISAQILFDAADAIGAGLDAGVFAD